MALFAALFFLIASVTTTAAVVYTLVTKKDQKADTSQQDQQQTSDKVGKPMDNFTPVDSVPTLQVTDLKVGDGAEAKANSKVTVEYVGALAKTGVVFDASPEGQPVELSLDQVIQGWQQGVPGMKVGGTRRLLIPAALAYGDQSPSAAIPANSDMVFDITLTKVE
jgi:FKBP-type peptidyl-prolyl cis-trans isomerase